MVYRNRNGYVEYAPPIAEVKRWRRTTYEYLIMPTKRVQVPTDHVMKVHRGKFHIF
jgi:hypothetical protein